MPDKNTEKFMRAAVRHQQAGRIQGAVTAYKQVLALQPGHLVATCSLAMALASCGRYQEAVTAYERALELKPDYVEAHNNLGNLFKNLGLTDRAIFHLKRAHTLAPDSAFVNNNLAALLKTQGRVDEAIVYYRRAVELKPDHAETHSNLIFTMNYSPKYSREELFNAHLEYAGKHARPLARFIQAHTNDRTPERRLKIGYVSGDFKQHSVAHYIVPALLHHDRRNVEVFGYYNQQSGDSVTDEIKQVFDHWRQISGISDNQVTQLIRKDKIDILIDLSGHTAHNRLQVFARKAAPLQVTWLGYPGTTGLSTMDYRITDEFADPPGSSDRYHTEQLIRLPACFSVYQASTHSPDVVELPALKTGHITFGSFNNLAKTHPAVLSLWARILNAIPDSRLILKCRGMDIESARQTVREIFSSLNIARDRLELHGIDRSTATHLQRYNHIDIGLDPFPYNGTTTTCEAAWMGVPVITLKGDRHAGRVGTSQMHNLGLEELVADNPDGYVAIAVKLAADLDRLRALRAGLRNRIEASPLMNAEKFTRQLETAYRDMWEKWCSAT